jgi:hypothetical protein
VVPAAGQLCPWRLAAGQVAVPASWLELASVWGPASALVKAAPEWLGRQLWPLHCPRMRCPETYYPAMSHLELSSLGPYSPELKSWVEQPAGFESPPSTRRCFRREAAVLLSGRRYLQRAHQLERPRKGR